jgi:hypothetical protein
VLLGLPAKNPSNKEAYLTAYKRQSGKKMC